MIPQATSLAARRLVRAATSTLYSAAMAVRDCDSSTTRSALLANARLFAATEELDLLMLDADGRRGDDFGLNAVVLRANSPKLLALEDQLVAAAIGFSNANGAPAAVLRRAARLYASGFQAADRETVRDERSIAPHDCTQLSPGAAP